MNNQNRPVNPFESPALSTDGGLDTASIAVDRNNMPAALRAIGIVFLILGILGVLGGIWGLVGLIFAEAIQFGVPPEMRQDVTKLTWKYAWLTIPLSLVSLILSSFLIAAGAGILKRKPSSFSLGAKVALAAFFYKFVETGITYFIQWKTMGTFAKMQPENPMPPEVFQGIMLGGLVCGFVFAVLPLLIFYGWSARYLSNVRSDSLTVQ
jgi:uncharacterized membrane protein